MPFAREVAEEMIFFDEGQIVETGPPEQFFTDPKSERAKKFMRGFGAVVSFEIKGDPAVADKVCEAAKLITYATSLGGVETLWERRRRWATESREVPENLIRISVGLESVEDLWEDISQALDKI